MPRPRSEAARRAILGAALELLEEEGYGRVTMEGIAKRAGVSKQTVYRWWPSPAAVLMEALNQLATVLVPDTDQGSLERDLRTFIRRTVSGLQRGAARLVASLMAEAQRDEDFAPAFREEFLARRRGAMRELLERARDRGEVAADADLDLLVEIGFGTIWYRVLGRHAPLSRRFADELTDALLALSTTATVSDGISAASRRRQG
jgi:AcrR family transcriptional regulator